MYNGIGLASVRGTATSGHVQANAGHVRNSRRHQARTAGAFDSSSRYHGGQRPGGTPLLTAEALQSGQTSLALHEKKRQLEVRLLELRDRLEERGWGDEEIEREIGKERRVTLDRWARAEEEEKRIVLAKRDADAAANDNENKSGEEEGGEGGAIEKSGGETGRPEPVNRERSDDNRGYRNHRDHDRGRYRDDNRYSDRRYQGGRGGRNAQQQQMFQEERNERLRNAFGISEQTHKEG